MGGKIIGNENMMQLYYNFENKTYKRKTKTTFFNYLTVLNTVQLGTDEN